MFRARLSVVDRTVCLLLWWATVFPQTSCGAKMMIPLEVAPQFDSSILPLDLIGKNRNLQSLEQIWDMSRFEYEVTGDADTSSVILTFQFRSSDRIDDDMSRVDLLDPETCTSPILLEESDESANPELTDLLNEMFRVEEPTSEDPLGTGFGYRNWTSTVNVRLPEGILEGLSNETSSQPVFEEEGKVRFCVRIALALPPSDDDFFSERPVTQIGLLVTIDEGLAGTVAEFEFPAITRPPITPRAYASFCDANNLELGAQPLIQAGDAVRICIFPPDEDIGDFSMLAIDFFEYQEIVDRETEYDESGNFTLAPTERGIFQAAITEGGIPSFNQLTQYECMPQVCVIQTVLVASFFEPDTRILASGYVTFIDNEESISSNQTEPEERGSDLFLAFETNLKIINILPSTTAPTPRPTMIPSDMPSTMPSSQPSMMPTSSAFSIEGLWFGALLASIGISTLLTW